MPHSILKDFKSNIGLYTSLALVYAVGYAARYAEKELNKLVEKLIRDACPDTPDLNRYLNQLDRIEKVSLNVNIKIDKQEQVIDKIKKAIQAGKVAADLLAHFNIPVTIGTPPGPAGGVIIALPQGLLLAQANVLRFINKTVNNLQDDMQGIVGTIKSARETFKPILAKVEVIRDIAQGCADDPTLSLTDRQNLLEGLKTNTTSNSTVGANSGIPFTSKTGKVYTIEVVTDPKSPAIAPRRKAIGKDLRGVVIIEGPLSFSSSTDVLIQELKFRINNQLP